MTEEVVYKVLGKITPVEVKEMINSALKGEFLDAREKLRVLLYAHGLSGLDVLKMMYVPISERQSRSEGSV